MTGINVYIGGRPAPDAPDWEWEEYCDKHADQWRENDEAPSDDQSDEAPEEE